ncbi:hypothetical protein H5410_050905, partial [Solanum commersonii]
VKNILRRTIRCSKSGTPINSAIRPLVSSITFLLCPSASSSSVTFDDQILHRLPCSILTMSMLCSSIQIREKKDFTLVIGTNNETQIQQLKKDASNSATQDSIMNAHKKTQITQARINCALKDLSCDSPLSKILKFTILASNESSSSTNLLKCPHTKNDSIFTHNGSTINNSGITINTHTHKDEHNA